MAKKIRRAQRKQQRISLGFDSVRPWTSPAMGPRGTTLRVVCCGPLVESRTSGMIQSQYLVVPSFCQCALKISYDAVLCVLCRLCIVNSLRCQAIIAKITQLLSDTAFVQGPHVHNSNLHYRILRGEGSNVPSPLSHCTIFQFIPSRGPIKSFHKSTPTPLEKLCILLSMSTLMCCFQSA